jgi:hypothetical protein
MACVGVLSLSYTYGAASGGPGGDPGSPLMAPAMAILRSPAAPAPAAAAAAAAAAERTELPDAAPLFAEKNEFFALVIQALKANKKAKDARVSNHIGPQFVDEAVGVVQELDVAATLNKAAAVLRRDKVDINAVYEADADASYKVHRSLLGQAVGVDDRGVVNFLLDNGAHINAAAICHYAQGGVVYSLTPLPQAITAGHVQMALLLIERKADIRDPENNILKSALRLGSPELVECLLRKDQGWFTRADPYSYVACALSHDSYVACEKHKDQNKDTINFDKNRNCLDILLAYSKQQEARGGVGINLRVTQPGEPPAVLLAAYSSTIDSARLLLHYGADIAAQVILPGRAEGWDSLDLVVDHKDYDFVHFILSELEKRALTDAEKEALAARRQALVTNNAGDISTRMQALLVPTEDPVEDDYTRILDSLPDYLCRREAGMVRPGNSFGVRQRLNAALSHAERGSAPVRYFFTEAAEALAKPRLLYRPAAHPKPVVLSGWNALAGSTARLLVPCAGAQEKTRTHGLDDDSEMPVAKRARGDVVDAHPHAGDSKEEARPALLRQGSEEQAAAAALAV